MIFPDYDRSILSTTASVLAHYGVDSIYPTLPELDAALALGFRHVSLLICDGMGVKPLSGALGESSFLRSHVAAEVTSVFPSTTTAATTSYYNGQSAFEHGWVGWHLWFKEYAADAVTFQKTNYYTHKKIDGPHPASTLMPFETVFEKIHRADPEVVCYAQTPFDSYSEHGADHVRRARSFRAICESIAEIDRTEGRSYTLSYWTEPDSTMHTEGVGSKKAISQFEAIDLALGDLCSRLNDTLLIVTTDHGLINSEPADIAKMPKLAECLILPPSIESRAATFFVKPHKKAAFEERFRAALGQDFLLLRREEALEKSLFGRGKASPKFDDFLGDYIACAVGSRHIDWSIPGVTNDRLIGLHAGLTEDEMLVPVILSTGRTNA